MNNFKPGEFWLDNNGVHINAHGGGVLFHDSKYYWYGEHKIAGEIGNTAQVGVHVYSSENLYVWTDEGICLKVSEDEMSEIAKGCLIERPKVIVCRKTGKFVMRFHLEFKGNSYKTARTGIAVSDSPVGEFEYLKSVRPNAGFYPANVPENLKTPLSKEEEIYLQSIELNGGSVPFYPKDMIFRRDFEEGQMSRDMTVFVDDDETAYQIYASEENGTLHIAELSEDYLDHSGEFIRIMAGRFNEAPAVLKHDGRYFILASGCTGWTPNEMRLLVADSIFGEWEEVGNPCQGNGSHVANSFESQPNFILKVEGKNNGFIYLGDRWRPKNAINGRYVWLPIQFRHGFPTIEWFDEWNLEFFDSNS